MERTAIRIPGKRTRDGSKSAVAARKSLHRNRGRPLMSVSKVVHIVCDETKEPKQRSLKNIKPKRKMGKLEKLPVELLEQIFGYCMNIDLPRSSPIIGGKLSSESVFTMTLFTAFGPFWGNARSEGDKVKGREYSALQSSILRCRWANIDCILKIQAVWIQKKGHICNPLPFLPEFQISDKECDLTDVEESNHIQTDFPNFSTVEYFEQDFASFSIFIKDGITEPSRPSWESMDGFSNVADGVEIPQSLLVGPWDENQIRYLFWTVKAKARVNWLTSTSGEMALLGQEKAIAIGDLRIIYLLQWAGLSETFDVGVLIWALQNAGGDRLRVLELLIGIGHSRLERLSSSDTNKLHRAVYLGHDERSSDKEYVEFLQKLQESPIFRSLGLLS